MFGRSERRASARPKRLSVQHRLLRPGVAVVFLGGASLAAGTFAPDQGDEIQYQEVSRSGAEQIVLPQPIVGVISVSASERLRAPVRVVDRQAKSQDLQSLVSRALETMEYQADADDRLRVLLIQTLAEGQSDKYIDAVLNAALGRGDFTVPSSMLLRNGDLDTPKLLDKIVRLSGA